MATTEDLRFYDGTSWQSLTELTASKVEAKLPIESEDGTVVLSDSSGNFVVSTGGKDKLTIDGVGRFKVFDSTGKNTFFVRSDGNVGVGTNGQPYERMTIEGSLVQSAGYPAVGAKVSTSFSNDGTGAVPSVFGFESQIAATGTERFSRVAHFMANKTDGADIIDNHVGFLANVGGGTDSYAFYSIGSTPSYFGGNIQSPSISGLTDDSASVALGASVRVEIKSKNILTLTENDINAYSTYEPQAQTSLVTKAWSQEKIDAKIWVGTTEQYLAIDVRDILPTTLYCLTD